MKKVKVFGKIIAVAVFLLFMGGGSNGWIGSAQAGITGGPGGGGEPAYYWRDCVNQTNYQECTQTVQTNTCTTLRDCWPGEL